MTIGVRHKGHPFPIPLTVAAHAEQKRAWPNGTNATRSRGTSSQTSHISVAGYVADVDVDVDIDVADATSSSVPSSLFGCEISSESTCATTEVAARRNCIYAAANGQFND